MIPRLATAHEKAGSAGILPAVARHRALDDVAGRMPALPFPWQWVAGGEEASGSGERGSGVGKAGQPLLSGKRSGGESGRCRVWLDSWHIP